MPYLGVLGINFEKLFLFMKSALSNLSYCKFWCKKKNSLILDQNTWLAYFWTRISKTIVIFEFRFFGFVKNEFVILELILA